MHPGRNSKLSQGVFKHVLAKIQIEKKMTKKVSRERFMRLTTCCFAAQSQNDKEMGWPLAIIFFLPASQYLPVQKKNLILTKQNVLSLYFVCLF